MIFSRTKRPALLFYTGGLVTSAVTLILIYCALAFLGFNVAGLYITVLPIGAVLAGMAAGSGYSLISKFFGIRVNRKKLLIVFAISLAVYAVATYVIFAADTGEAAPILFFRYLRGIAENSAMTIGRSSRAAIDSLGSAGFIFMILEYLGFAAGSIGPFLFLTRRPYCKTCQTYLRPKGVYQHSPELEKWDIAMGVTMEDKRAIIAANDAILKREFEKLKPLLQGRSLAENEKTLASLPHSERQRNSFYLTYRVLACPIGDTHLISATLASLTLSGFSPTDEELGRIEN